MWITQEKKAGDCDKDMTESKEVQEIRRRLESGKTTWTCFEPTDVIELEKGIYRFEKPIKIYGHKIIKGEYSGTGV